MPNYSASDPVKSLAYEDRFQQPWPTFKEILKRLHSEGIYIHSDQLAEFLLFHGLPVDLCFVPPHLQEKAKLINHNYGGDMAKLADLREEQF